MVSERRRRKWAHMSTRGRCCYREKTRLWTHRRLGDAIKEKRRACGRVDNLLPEMFSPVNIRSRQFQGWCHWLETVSPENFSINQGGRDGGRECQR